MNQAKERKSGPHLKILRGGRVAAPGYGCKTPPPRLVPSPRSLAVALRESGILVVSSQNSAGYEHAGLQPEPHKGTPRIGSGTAERRTPARTKKPPSREGRAAGTRRRPRLRRGENVEDVERRRRGER